MICVSVFVQYGNTPIMMSSHNGHEGALQALLAAKADLNVRNKVNRVTK